MMSRIKLVLVAFFLVGRIADAFASDDTNWWTGFSTEGMDGRVRALTVYNGQLVAGGDFLNAGTTPANRVAAWDGSQWHALGAGLDGRVQTLTVHDGKLIAAGGFLKSGALTVNRIAAWDGANWTSFGIGIADFVNTVATYQGDLIAGGFFFDAGGTSVTRIARWDGASWFDFFGGADRPVEALREVGGDLVVGGEFLNVGGSLIASYIARHDGLNWQTLHHGMNGSVRALEEYGGKLIAAGFFTQADLDSALYIAEWDGKDWAPLGGAPTPGGLNSGVHALAVYDGSLIAAGVFTQAGGNPADRIAEWNGSQWSALGSGANSTVHDLAPLDGSLYVGGNFLLAGLQTSEKIARWSVPAVSAREREAVSNLSLALAPNPLSGGRTVVRFELDREAAVRIDAYDAAGRHVQRIRRGVFGPGVHRVSWAPGDLPAGVYFVRLDASGFRESKSVTILRP